MGPGQGQARKY